MRHSTPEDRARVVVVFDRDTDARADYQALGVQTAIWPEIKPVFLEKSWRNWVGITWRHSVGGVRMAWRLWRLQPALILSNTEMLFVTHLAAKLNGIPHLQIFHALSFRYRFAHQPALLRRYLQVMAFWNRALIGVSQTLVDALIEGGVPARKVALIPNPIADLSASPRLPPEIAARLAAHTPILVCVGKLSPMKGQDYLVEALPALSANYPSLLCVFAGGVGSAAGLDDTHTFAAQLEQTIRDSGLTEHVLCLGEIDYVPTLLQAADVVVQPSRTESFGRVVAEALLCKKPVVAFDAGALREVVGAGGKVVPLGDIEALALAISDLVDRPEERARLGELGRAHVLGHFEAARVTRLFWETLGLDQP